VAVTDFRALLDALVAAQVEFVVIGGVAVVAHGHTRFTEDLDVCYRRTPENIERLAAALAPLKPSLRGAPSGLPFVLDARSIRSGLNFTLETQAGDVDLLGEVTGVGGYDQIAPSADNVEIYGHSIRIMSLAMLLQAKRATGRAKDLADLEALREIEKRARR
jgi:hypothetical protein